VVVISKFDAVNVGIALRPSWPVRFVMRNRIFKSAVLSSRSVEYTRRAGQSTVEINEESCSRRSDLGCDQIGGVPRHQKEFRIVIVSKVCNTMTFTRWWKTAHHLFAKKTWFPASNAVDSNEKISVAISKLIEFRHHDLSPRCG